MYGPAIPIFNGLIFLQGKNKAGADTVCPASPSCMDPAEKSPESRVAGRAAYLHFLFPRATSQADMPACPFGDCREGQIPRSLAALQI